MRPASDFLVEVADVEVPVAVPVLDDEPEALLEEEDALLLEEVDEPLVEVANFWIVSIRFSRH